MAPKVWGSTGCQALSGGGVCRLIHFCWDVAKSVSMTLGKVPSALGCISLGVTWMGKHFFFLTFKFVLGYSRLTNNVMIISGEQRRDSAIHIHVSILP